MDEMIRKKFYIWRLANFLRSHSMQMCVGELAEHLNRNSFLTSYGEEYKGGRGTFKLVQQTWKFVNNELGLGDEAKNIAEAYPSEDGTFAYDK